MANLSYGSSGDEVKKLQTLLNQQGYSLDVDGSYGPKTQAAVKDYQNKNNLTVDGIVGDQTWGTLSGASTSAAPKNTAASSENTSAVKQNRPEYEQSDQLKDAEEDLEQWENNAPADYIDSYADQIEAMLEDLQNGAEFNYDLNADALYQQYKDQYTRQGRNAMQDTLGQAAALTGGYGSSYGVTASSEAYQEYLNKLSDVAPELQKAAYQRYLDDRSNQKDILELLRSLEDDDYERYRDGVSDYRAKGEYLLDKAADMSDEEWEQFLQLIDAYESDRDFEFDEEKFEHEKDQDAQDQKNWEKEYNLKRTTASSKSSSGGSSRRSGSSRKSGSSEKSAKETRASLLEQYKEGALKYPTTYSDFYKVTGYPGIMTETEFARRGTAKYSYDGDYQKYLREMFEIYFMKE